MSRALRAGVPRACIAVKSSGAVHSYDKPSCSRSLSRLQAQSPVRVDMGQIQDMVARLSRSAAKHHLTNSLTFIQPPDGMFPAWPCLLFVSSQLSWQRVHGISRCCTARYYLILVKSCCPSNRSHTHVAHSRESSRACQLHQYFTPGGMALDNLPLIAPLGTPLLCQPNVPPGHPM